MEHFRYDFCIYLLFELKQYLDYALLNILHLSLYLSRLRPMVNHEHDLLEEQVVTVLQKGTSTRQNLLEQVSLTIKHFVPKKS